MMRLNTIRRPMARLRRSLKAVWNHPLTQKDRPGALPRYFLFHLLGRLAPGPVLFPYVGSIGFLARPGMAGIAGNIYMGLEDFEEQAFLLHFLRPGDLLVDVGANVGAYTLLASGVCGARSLAIEPIPGTFVELMRNIRLNDLAQLVTGCNVGARSQRAWLTFTTQLGVRNRVVTRRDSELSTANVTEVEILPLDELLAGRSAALLKIDVEGYEQEVLHGAGTLLQSQDLKAILIELGGEENRYGFSSEDVHQHLLSCGFVPGSYHPFERRIELLHTFNHDKYNTLYVREGECIDSRLRQAVSVEVLNQLI
jgi:FkbM family methyltransferase